MKQTKVYISSCCPEGGIYCFSLDAETLCQVGFVSINRPMYTVKDKDRLYAVLRAPFSDSDDSGIVSYKINADGTLTDQSETVSTKGKVGCHLLVDGDDVYATNYISGSVIKLPDNLVVHQGSSIHKTRQESAHTHFVTKTPDNKYLLVTDLGMDKIVVYDKNLNKVHAVDTPKGAGPRHLAFSHDGSLLYCVNELTSSVSVYAYFDGTLKLKNTYSTLPVNFCGENTAAAIRCTEKYVYVSNRGHNSIACFLVNGDCLELKAVCDCCGDSPRDFALSGDLLLCANENDGSVTVFRLEHHTNFKLLQKIPIKNALCITIC